MFKIFSPFFIIIIIYVFGNLTGFSWKKLQYTSRDIIIDAAVRDSSNGVYSNLEEMQRDYSKFEPQLRYWGSWHWEFNDGVLMKLLGFKRYQVLMPDALVFVDVNGEVLFSRSGFYCDGDNCPNPEPNILEQGIVGTVQYGPPDYEVANEFSVRWEQENESDFLSLDHCFSIYHDSPKRLGLVVDTKNLKPLTIYTNYGYFMVSIFGDNVYSRKRVSKAEFLKAKTCQPEERKTWSGVGGWAWKK